MNYRNWVTVAKIPRDFQAEILRSLLEANEIPVILSSEGAGRAIGLTIGALGEVDMLVPDQFEKLAREILQQYNNGDLEALSDDEL